MNVDISEDDLNLTVVVKSKGDLISEDDSQKIFDAFKRGANSQQRSGSGLGLRICKRILDFHHAEILYRSEGSELNVFVVKFPLG